MKLLWCCVVAASILSVTAVDVEKTVKQVQSILQANSGLPRLTRDEIIQLLNDIRAEDAKSKSSSTSTSTEDSREVITTVKPYRVEDNEITPETHLPIQKNVETSESENASKPAKSTHTESTTKKNEPSVVVVLPYTPRDGSSLQELYTRPPRVEVVPESQVTSTAPPKLVDSLEKLHKTLNKNKFVAKKPKKDEFPAELQAFLNAHGLKGKPGQDHFLLPLDGFKPLPPAKVVDGTVQLPENILLTYDLISSDTEPKPAVHQPSPNNFLYEPLRPEFPFELDMSPSKHEEMVLPLDLPVRKTKSTSETSKTNFESLEDDSVRVIPLSEGISPLDEVKTAAFESDPNKRQTDNAAKTSTANSGATSNETKSDATADSAAADSGASIADLEDSFGGAAPEEPGDSEIPPPRKNGFYWMLDWNSFLEVGDGDTKVNIRFEPKLGDPQMFIPVNVP